MFCIWDDLYNDDSGILVKFFIGKSRNQICCGVRMWFSKHISLVFEFYITVVSQTNFFLVQENYSIIYCNTITRSAVDYASRAKQISIQNSGYYGAALCVYQKDYWLNVTKCISAVSVTKC